MVSGKDANIKPAKIDLSESTASTLDRAVRWMSPLLLLGLTYNILRAWTHGGLWSSGMQTAATLLALVIAFNGARIPAALRMVIYCGCLMAYGLIGLVQWGLAGQGMIILVLAMIFASAFSFRFWLSVSLTSLVCVSVIGLAWVQGWLPLWFDPAPLMRSPSAWLTAVFTLFVAGFASLVWEAILRDMKGSHHLLRESEEKFRLLVEATSDWIWETDVKGIYSYVSPQVFSMLGYHPDEIIGRKPFDFMPPDEASRVMAEFAQISAEQRRFSALENVNICKDGRRVVLETSGVPKLDSQGNLLGYRGIDRDITSRKLIEAALRDHQQMIHAIVESSQDWIWAIDLSGRHTYSNPAVRQILGYTPEEFQGMGLDLLHPEDRRTVDSQWPGWIEARQGWNNVVLRWRRKDGTYRYIESAAVPFFGPDGDLLGFRGVDRDITERIFAEKEIRREKQFSDSVIEGLPGIFFMIDSSGRIVRWNHQAEVVTGYSGEEIRPMSVNQFFDAREGPLVEAKMQQVFTAGKADIEAGIITKTGQRIAYYLIGWLKELDHSPYLIGFGVDITARKQAEAEREALIHELAARNTELEGFIYTVSHDLKSPLVTIAGFVGYLEKDALTGNTDRMKSDIQRINEAIYRMQRMLDELLKLSRVGRLMNPPERIPLSEIVNEALELVHGQLAAGGVQVRVADDLPVISGDRVRLVEVVQNLVDNAAKFMGQQPQPCIRIGVRQQGSEPVFFVSDNGIGIEPQYHEKVFGLFEKLDKRSEGSGIGLALVKRIIEVHGGRIWVESEPGQGATFCFTLA